MKGIKVKDVVVRDHKVNFVYWIPTIDGLARSGFGFPL